MSFSQSLYLPCRGMMSFSQSLYLPCRGVLVAQLTATDDDYGNSAPLEYVIVDGNDGGVFSIDLSSGLVTVRDTNKLNNYYKLKVTNYYY